MPPDFANRLLPAKNIPFQRNTLLPKAERFQFLTTGIDSFNGDAAGFLGNAASLRSELSRNAVS